MKSRVEVNFVRLLNQCETLASDDKPSNWRLEKYVAILQERLTELRRASGDLTDVTIKEYARRVEILEGVIASRKMDTIYDKMLTVDSLPTSGSIATTTSQPTRQLLMQTKADYMNQMREELMGRIDDGLPSDKGLRQRSSYATDDINSVLQHHNQMQERIAEEMLSLTRNLKSNASAAGKIIQDDNLRLLDSNKLASANYDKLKTESDRLEVHTKKSCNWWIWIMLVIVCLVFIWTILFIRFFPRR